MVMVEAAYHVHVHTAKKRFARSSGTVVGDAVRNEFGYCSVVAIYNSLECPFALENLLQCELIRRRWNSIQRIERAHQRGRALVNRCVEWRQVKLPQSVLGNLDGIVVAAAFRGPIAHKMFRA